ncbi:MAG TPA: hypothetical protein PKA64_22230, partial [Myxococcota bacterium]|nr:hypothetical protein [Myxococcota bacterium]
LCLAAQAAAAKPPAEPKPDPRAAAAPAGRASYDWTQVTDRIARGDWQTAATEIEAVLADPARSGDHPLAWGMLGEALTAANIPYAGLLAYLEGVKAAPLANLAFYEDILRLGTQLHEERLVGQVLGADFGVPMSPEVRAGVAIMAARYHVSQESWGVALGLLPMVPADGPYAVDALVLRGVALAQQARYADALEPLLQAREKARDRDDHFRNVLDLDIARTYYAAGNFGRAMEFYGHVARGDSAWPEALFERAWAHFRVEDMTGTLAVLLTHHSPFFNDWYFPEAELLRAQSLFLMCKFPDTKTTIDFFETRYKPTLDGLRQGLGQLDAKGAFTDAKAMVEGNTTKLPADVLRRFTWDGRLADAVEAIGAADADLVKLDRLASSPYSARPKALLQARRDARVAEEGGRVLGIARDAEADLADMLTGIELTRVDILTYEARLYEQAAALGGLPEEEDMAALRKEQTRKGKRMWPFEGEYWADELGWYRVTARPDCPPDLRGQ